MNAIINTKLVMEDGIIWDGALTWENGEILEAGRADTVTIPQDCAVYDAQGLYTAPGLIDIHNHGSADILFAEDPKACADFFLRHGETTVLPTFYCNLTLEQMLQGAEKIRQTAREGSGKILRGLYMEGPYMDGTGSNQKSILWHGEIRQAEYRPLLDALKDLAMVWAIDPGRPGIEGFMADVKALQPEAIFALGHSGATAEQCRRVRKYGVRLRTHITNGGKSKGRCQGGLGAGCDEYALYEPDMFVELICDESGVHVVPDLVKLIIRTKGHEKIVLITDSMASKEKFTNNAEAGIWFGSDLNYDYDGMLAGSRMTLENAVRNVMTHTGYGLCHAIRMATLNPAQLLGIDGQVGSLAPGKKANLILIDDMVHIQKVILEGQLAVDGDTLLI